MKKYMNRYLEIYNHFLSQSKDTLTEKDWLMLGELSSDKRLWYRAGARMSSAIDIKSGRNKLTGLISEPFANFIKTYLILVINKYFTQRLLSFALMQFA